MSRFAQSIERAADALRCVKAHLDRISGCPTQALVRNIYADWERIVKLSQKLDDTIPFLKKRDFAEMALCDFDKIIKWNVDKELSGCTTNSGSVEMPVSVARDMALADYVMQTWVVYDRIANVAGRIAGSVDISRNENAANNPKLLRYFVKVGGCKDRPLVGGFSIDEYLKDSFAWQIIAASRVRNCIIHDGGYINSKPFFAGDLIRDLFVLNDAAAAELNSELEKEAQRTGFKLIAREEFFNFTNSDIRPQLKLLHDEIARAVAVLIGWACDSFLDLVRHFSYLERGPVGTVWV